MSNHPNTQENYTKIGNKGALHDDDDVDADTAMLKNCVQKKIREVQKSQKTKSTQLILCCGQCCGMR